MICNQFRLQNTNKIAYKGSQQRYSRNWRGRPQIVSSGSGLRSFDSDDELEVSQELQSRIQVYQAVSAKKRLELLWAMQSKAKQSQMCGCCKGCGQQECDWCHGTGVLTVGDTLLCDTVASSSKCAVCKGQGYVSCDHCKGIGRVAGWMEPGCQLGK
eukprot:TRINITY_DN21003_c0_g3_i2.p3 TRINITY_DN21003_c0_g3~~TRINITY_DN21003_c0_g3_i2.p3  ORF type:complete len:157 (+),score=11.11 TRINITY_DN21003_c0_g3_i2:155-625(+)